MDSKTFLCLFMVVGIWRCTYFHERGFDICSDVSLGQCPSQIDQWLHFGRCHFGRLSSWSRAHLECCILSSENKTRMNSINCIFTYVIRLTR